MKLHMTSLLSWLLVGAAVLLGADGSFAMAEMAGADVEMAPSPNPSTNMEEYDSSTNPEGRPAGEALQEDENGGKTQLQGKTATATDARDAGLEAEDYDKKIVEFRRFRFPVETYIANRCIPVKCDNYTHYHYRSAATDLDAVYNQASDLTLGTGAKTVTIAAASIDNFECIFPYSQVFVSGSCGYKKDDNGNEVPDGELVLFCTIAPDNAQGNFEFNILNPSAEAKNAIVIPGGSLMRVGASACSESQMHVAPETYLPEKKEVTLQKKIATCVITDEFDSQSKKVPFGKKDVKNNTLYNFKRKCARSHWMSTPTRFQVKVRELNNAREDVYTENGILHQIPMLYTHAEQMTDDDLIAISSLMFTDYAVSERATAFCGKKEIRRIMKLVNSATHFKDVDKVSVNEYGIKVRKLVSQFGEIELVYDPTLDDIGYQDFMVVLDLDNAVRYYKVNDKESSRDMKKTGEAREAQEYNICRTDCVALRGFNAVLVCPASAVDQTKKLQGILANASTVSTIAGATDKTKIYFVSGENRLVQWDADFQAWVDFEGKLASV
ncbi:MAG: hypothetical protein MJZ12_00280 [Prevotella sp.]|nr:hypothetical protein [Prevotella sp.]